MAVQGEGEEVYATLLLTDTYLPGALVLAHSLRDAGTTKKLVALITPDSVSVEAIAELESVYDQIITVPRIRNAQPANLQLMNRTDLHSAFTKINLWNLTQFRKIVYIDADVVAYRAPDELFGLAHPFSAAPDIGWPDIFNTGVMALTPNKADYDGLIALAERGESFDGADQGLINTYFGNKYNRLSFTYNVTPSAHYQYVPAYRHFQSGINMVHFIGPDKPWFQGRQSSTGGSPFDEITGKWWSVYDKHYNGAPTSSRSSDLVRYLTKGEFQPSSGNQPQQHFSGYQGTSGNTSSWDAQKYPPPTSSKPEAINFHGTTYSMSKSATPFIAPSRYPAPPNNMGYDIPQGSPADSADQLRPIFPWEAHRPKPSRVFVEGTPSGDGLDGPPSDDDAATQTSTVEQSDPATPTSPTADGADPWTSYSRTNAWDENPQIERYVETQQRTRKAPGTVVLPGHKLTDFPTETERPSLPVTPAPQRRPNQWDGGSSISQGDNGTQLPSAAGVPRQGDWDPLAQLQKLAKQQGEGLLQKLSGSNTDSTRSDGVLSPQPVKGSGSPGSRPSFITDLETTSQAT